MNTLEQINEAIKHSFSTRPNPDIIQNNFQNEIISGITSFIQKYSNEIGNCSDGYHTFNELYEFRKLYNAHLFNEWSKQDKYNTHKSLKHHDGELCFGGGWFVVVAILPTGQITNHYPIEDWDLFKIKEVESALFPFDGHTSKDVLERMKSYI
jgi:hypothetical protein